MNKHTMRYWLFIPTSCLGVLALLFWAFISTPNFTPTMWGVIDEMADLNIQLLQTLEIYLPSLQNLLGSLVSFFLILCSCRFLIRRRVDKISVGLFILAAVLSLHYLHISNNDAYTNDVGWHLDYITYISQNWLKPYGYSMWTLNHPPLYYYIAAIVTTFNQLILDFPDRTVLRFLSWGCFLVFHIFNLLTLRRSGFSGITYYTCAALLLLWPANAHLASKINSEAMYYAMAAIVFYYTIAWYQEGNQRALMKAILVVGIALTIRTNAIVLLVTIGTLILIKLLRGHTLISTFFTKQWLTVAAIFLLCFAICFGGMLFYSHAVSTFIPSQGSPFPLSHYLSLNYTFKKPFNDWDMSQGFLEYLLRTSMFGEYQWTSPQLAIAMNYFIVAILIYAALPWSFAARTLSRGMLPHLIYLFFSIAFVVYFSLCIKDLPSQDIRYSYPALISFIVLFGKSHQFYRQHCGFILSGMGTLLVAGFTILSSYFFWNNFR